MANGRVLAMQAELQYIGSAESASGVYYVGANIYSGGQSIPGDATPLLSANIVNLLVDKKF